ncbi:CVNH domain-containing protein [Penicillium ucsense]|uniref:CVNH domain-containing protein n=1 Tax=Penicillium ucsense TaxID=2839758 RepID=A0A8J8VWE8_9EURO|nr:CVNH domain-containing protein [Penicillium ucsense]KAF7729909.1 CVNH domain-containing protein [Penicillium ucsense]
MGFHKSSLNVKLKDGHMLSAYCQRPTGEAVYSELDLNEFLGVRKGKLTWSGHNFTQTAENIHLEWEGDGKPQNPILHADVYTDPTVSAESAASCVNLADCIKNEDGHLRFMDCF